MFIMFKIDVDKEMEGVLAVIRSKTQNMDLTL